MGITVQRSLSPGAMFWDDIESPGPSYAVKPQSAWNRAWAKGVFICVDRSIWSKSTTYSEIFSGIRICTSCKNHPVQKYYENPLNTSTVKTAMWNIAYEMIGLLKKW